MSIDISNLSYHFKLNKNVFLDGLKKEKIYDKNFYLLLNDDTNDVEGLNLGKISLGSNFFKLSLQSEKETNLLVTGFQSAALGKNLEAKHNYTFAQGIGNKALEKYATAFNATNISLGQWGFSANSQNKNFSKIGAAFGINNVIGGQISFVCGQNNIEAYYICIKNEENYEIYQTTCSVPSDLTTGIFTLTENNSSKSEGFTGISIITNDNIDNFNLNENEDPKFYYQNGNDYICYNYAGKKQYSVCYKVKVVYNAINTDGYVFSIINTDNNTPRWNFLSGYGNIISKGSYNAIFGNSNKNNGDYNLLTGNSNSITGKKSIVGGSGNIISRPTVTEPYHYLEDGTFAFGLGLIAQRSSQMVIGRYNEPDLHALFVIGGGFDNNSRLNIFTVVGGCYKNNGNKVKDPYITINCTTKILNSNKLSFYKDNNNYVDLTCDANKVLKIHNGEGTIIAATFQGNATSADKLGTSAGSEVIPVYFQNGIPVACTSLTLNTTGSSGSCTGNAATASKLQTSRKIGGKIFDGTVDIDLPGVNIKGNQDTTGTAEYAQYCFEDKDSTGKKSIKELINNLATHVGDIVLNEETVKLKSNLYTAYNVGKITNASLKSVVKIANAGDNLKTVFNAIFGEIVETQPTITQTPSIKITLSYSGDNERDTKINSINYSIQFEDGKYTNSDTTGAKMSSYTLTGGTPSSTTSTTGTLTLTSAYTIGSGNSIQTIISASHSEGAIAKTNLGNNSNPPVKINSGTVSANSNSLTISAVDYPYYISSSIEEVSGFANQDFTNCRKTISLINSNGENCNYNGNAYVWIFIRKGNTLTQPEKTIQGYSDIAKEWAAFLGGTELKGTIEFTKKNGIKDTFFAYRTKNVAQNGDSITIKLS